MLAPALTKPWNHRQQRHDKQWSVCAILTHLALEPSRPLISALIRQAPTVQKRGMDMRIDQTWKNRLSFQIDDLASDGVSSVSGSTLLMRSPVIRIDTRSRG